MGPEPSRSAISTPHDISRFDAYKDVLQWRKAVSEWVDTIRIASEKGFHKRYKTIYTILGRRLVEQGLPLAQKSIVEEAQAKGRIDFRQEDQIQAVQEIVDLVAVDPPIAMANRLISSFNKVTSCRRKKAEDLVTFVDRFRGLASVHLMHTVFESLNHIGEVLSITLINNAMLPENTLHNAVLQLLTLSQSRSSNGMVTDGGLVSFSAMDNLRTLSDDLTKLMDPIQIPEAQAEVVRTFEEFRKNVESIKDRLVLQTAKLPFQKGDSKPPNIKAIAKSSDPRAVLHLEDAVTVLYSLSSTTKRSSSDMTRTDIEVMVQERVQKALLAVGVTSSANKSNLQRTTDSPSGIQKPKHNEKRGPKARGASGSKKNDTSKVLSKIRGFCFNCGSTTHYRGSKECLFTGGETFLDRMNRLEREASQKKPGDSFFQAGSAPSSGNQA